MKRGYNRGIRNTRNLPEKPRMARITRMGFDGWEAWDRLLTPALSSVEEEREMSREAARERSE
jgi:hypothetical protein